MADRAGAGGRPSGCPGALGTRSRSRPSRKLSFIEGIRTITTSGDVGTQTGMGAHIYLVTRSMVDEYFYNADGESCSCRSKASSDCGRN